MPSKNAELIAEIEQQGYVVEVIHKRLLSYGQPVPRGGSTVVIIADVPGKLVITKEARCSRDDNFNKRQGLTIALGRAVAELDGKANTRAEKKIALREILTEREFDQIYGEGHWKRTPELGRALSQEEFVARRHAGVVKT